jgi:uncharacterized protein
MFSVKIHSIESEKILACCDIELLEKTLDDGELEVEISRSFYGGETMNSKQFIESLKKSTTANIIGDRAVDAAVSAGCIKPSSVIKLCGIKHAQLYLI